MSAIHKQFTIRYPLETSAPSENTYKLLELPPDLCKLIENHNENNTEPLTLKIKGKDADDAVLCTPNKTYSMRSIALSNSVLVLTGSSRDPATLEYQLDGANPEDCDAITEPLLFIRDTLTEIIELVPAMPKLDRLQGLLRGCEYDEVQEEDEGGSDDDDQPMNDENDDSRPRKRRRITYQDVDNVMQASDLELAKAIRERHILHMDGHLRPLAPTSLTHILTLLLNAIASLSLSPSNAPVAPLLQALEQDHEISREVTSQVIHWYGEVSADERWTMNKVEIVKQVGLGLLRPHKNDPILESLFLDKWKKTVGDTFEDSVSIQLLNGSFLLSPTSNPTLSYFPCSELPVAPAARFADLFLTRARWKAQDIAHFLQDVAIDQKARDALLLKHARATVDADGICWYTTRATHT